MTSKTLVTTALKGLPVPRVPVGPLAVHSCAGLAGYSLRRYSTDAKALADSVIRYYERFKPDAVWVSADTWVSAEAMGAKVGATEDNQPLGGIGEPRIQCAADIDRIPAPDVSSQGRYPLMLEALSRVVDKLGKEVFIVACFDQYPFSLAAALMGINEIMLKVFDDPPFVQAVMERCSEYALAYATALSRAGADLLSGGDSPAGLLGPDAYRDLALPAERGLIERIQAATGKPVSLHICGNATPLLPAMKTSGANVLELDHAVSVSDACRIIGPEIALWGNLNPVAALSQGTPERVTEEALRVLAAVDACGHRRFVLSSGCTLAVETPARNIEALIAAACQAKERIAV
ncbi:MAG: uroporphyrinogen decarboxylase family protein [Verrucomicrobia bacterium]|nr:uroporphyrinogen decarboxylase family protein [Verrucomicrobiota bacterium]